MGPENPASCSGMSPSPISTTPSARARPSATRSRSGPLGKTWPLPKGLPASMTTMRQGFLQRRVLVAIVHHDQLNAIGLHGAGAGGAILRDPAFAGGGEHQRLVAHFAGRVACGIDAVGAFERAAIAAREAGGAQALGRVVGADDFGHGRLAGAAEREVADADDGEACVERGGGADAALACIAVEHRQGRHQQLGHRRGGARALVGDAPEIGLTHWRRPCAWPAAASRRWPRRSVRTARGRRRTGGRWRWAVTWRSSSLRQKATSSSVCLPMISALATPSVLNVSRKLKPCGPVKTRLPSCAGSMALWPPMPGMVAPPR